MGNVRAKKHNKSHPYGPQNIEIGGHMHKVYTKYRYINSKLNVNA